MSTYSGNNEFDFVIIGGGSIGASVFQKLCKEGKKVLLLERRSDLAQGATGAWGALLRLFSTISFYEDGATESLDYYRNNVEKDLGISNPFMETGSLYFIRPTEEKIFSGTVLRLKKQSGLKISIINSDEGRDRFPMFQWFENDFAIYEENSGLTCPTTMTWGWVSNGQKNGGFLKTQQKVIKFNFENKNVKSLITESGAEYFGKQFIIAAGPQTGKLTDMLEVNVPLEAKTIQLNRFLSPSHIQSMKYPFFLETSETSFGRPMPDGSFVGGFVNEESSQSLTSIRQPISLKEAAEAKKRLSKRLKWLRTSALSGGIRAYESYSKEDRPLIQRLKSFENVIIASGWCCTGFALTPFYSRKISELALGRGLT